MESLETIKATSLLSHHRLLPPGTSLSTNSSTLSPSPLAPTLPLPLATPTVEPETVAVEMQC